MKFKVADYLDVLDYILTRTRALLEIIPDDDKEARELTIRHIAVLDELRGLMTRVN